MSVRDFAALPRTWLLPDGCFVLLAWDAVPYQQKPRICSRICTLIIFCAIAILNLKVERLDNHKVDATRADGAKPPSCIHCRTQRRKENNSLA